MEENTQTKSEAITEKAEELGVPVVDISTTPEVPSVVQEVIESEAEVGEKVVRSLLSRDMARISDKEKRRRRLANKRAREQRRIQRRQVSGKGR